MRQLVFEKYEGLGNDFLLLTEPSPALREDEVRALCDRHFGVGADGVLVVSEGGTPGAAARMTVWNADGSRPEMCGNGLRCVAAHIARLRRARAASFVIDTDSGPRGCEVDGALVRIDMGRAELSPERSVEIGGETVRFTPVSLGNPHAVLLGPSGPEAFARLAPALSCHPAFAAGANVEFARVLPGSALEVRVWERGVGPTLACGTGACAAAAVAASSGLVPFGEDIEVRLPGGALAVRVARDYRIEMRGPARRVFAGEVAL